MKKKLIECELCGDEHIECNKFGICPTCFYTLYKVFKQVFGQGELLCSRFWGN